MTLAPLARRSLGLLATTALLTSGAVGVLSGVAYAIPNDGVPASISPATTNNSADTGITVTGTGFAPATDHVRLKPTFPSAYGDKTKTPVLDATTSTAASDTTHLVGVAPTGNAAPGVYEVYTVRKDPTGATADTESAKCACTFTINSTGAPNLSNVTAGASTGNTDRGNGALDLTGQQLAEASFVGFYLPDGTTPDPGLTFEVGDPNDGSYLSGYASSTLIRGNYVQGANFTPGKHLIRVTNTAGQTGAAVEFWQPVFTAAGVSPDSTGAGTQNKIVTVTGQGIRPGSTLGIQAVDLDPSPSVTKPDVTVGRATVSADGTMISAPVSVDPGADTNTARLVAIRGPEGSRYAVANAFRLTPAPKLTSLDTPAIGQGASYVETVSGSNFAAGGTATTMPTFTVSGTGVTTQTLSSTNISAQVRFSVAPDAPVGGRSITVSNPDGGSSTAAPTSTNAPFTVDAGPTVSSVTPPSTGAGTSKTVTIVGTNFALDGGVSVQVSLPPAQGEARTDDPSIAVGPVTVTQGSNGGSDRATFTLSVSSTAPAGLRDVILTNTADHGSFLCAGCFGVDNLTVSPASGGNTGPRQLALSGGNVVPGSSARLVRAGDPTIQPAIPGTSATVTGTTLTATFDLTDAAPGPYNALVTTPSGSTLACTQCFTVVGSAPTISSVAPASGGQGAKNRPITIAGNNFSRGERLSITDVAVHDVVWVSHTQLTALVDIASSAATGAKDVKVTNADGALSATKAGGFTVNAAPDPTDSTPASYGQGAKAVKVTVTGPGFANGATVDLGPGVTVVGTPSVTQGMVIPILAPDPPDTLEATVNIAESAPALLRDVVVVNPDGGRGTLPGAFAVNFGPKVTSVAPTFLKPDGTGKLTITGSNFSTTSGKTAVPTIAGVTLSNVVVASDGNSLTADAKVNSGTGKGPALVTVTNPTDSGAGSCASCFFVATQPGPPTNVHTVGTSANGVTAGWNPPTDNGGAPITAYIVSAKDPAGRPSGTPATVGGGATQGTVTGLTSGVRYTISVIARNMAGDSTAGTTIAQTGGVAPQGDTLLTSSHRPSLTTTGQTMVLSGRLLKVGTGAGIAGATVELALAPDIGSASFPKLTTDSTGAWSFTFHPIYSHTIKTIYRGDANNGPSQAKSYRMGVSTRVTVTSPANGVRSSVRSPLVVRGGTSPNKSGALITLYRWNGSFWAAVQNSRVAGDGSYLFSYGFGRGNWTLKVGIGRTTGNFVGYSPAFGVYRR